EHYQKGYFDYTDDGFGPIAESEDELLDFLEKSAEMSFENEEKYISRSSSFFTLYDEENCLRTYNAVVERWK
ncbi:MAG: CDP-glycerol glycerophosphotransferase family protein, partial [Clostridia bacterium]|nr:CDP-glycerol glycerophosphotransferase family protein [Clostridia bacterium]